MCRLAVTGISTVVYTEDCRRFERSGAENHLQFLATSMRRAAAAAHGSGTRAGNRWAAPDLQWEGREGRFNVKIQWLESNRLDVFRVWTCMNNDGKVTWVNFCGSSIGSFVVTLLGTIDLTSIIVYAGVGYFRLDRDSFKEMTLSAWSLNYLSIQAKV